ncbi:MAG: hypothetical protein LBP21_05220, partial [Synergistaceae bacterium]|nr:hypothetical protein [Synergistaceae bacterium]
MAKKKIDLHLTGVNTREMRLGTITSWDGSASELVNASKYNSRGGCRGCGGNGKGCRLQELKMPFNQQTMCSHSIVACQLGNLTDCVLVEHSPIGCSASAAGNNQS